MLKWIIKQFSGRHYRQFVKKCQPIVKKINEIEVGYQKLSAEELRAKTDEFKGRIAKGVEQGKTQAQMLDELLPEAFAAVKNAARRLVGQTVDVCGHPINWQMVHFDVQLMGGMALHQNRITEMATGEGKTLVATLPLYLNALTGRNCQLVTVNDYLARRDSEWMGYLYRQLGLTVGCLQNQMGPQERQIQYGCDITYGTASEFGFDYLRDNGMTFRKIDQVQRDHYYAIIDEVDSILIDEARTPLIISGVSEDDTQLPYLQHKPMVERLVRKQDAMCNKLAGEAKEILTESSQGNSLVERKKLSISSGKIFTLGDVLGNVDSLDPKAWVYLPADKNWSLGSKCAILVSKEVSSQEENTRDAGIPELAKKNNFVQALPTTIVQEIVDNIEKQNPNITLDDIFRAFVYYYNNDAFIVDSGSNDKPLKAGDKNVAVGQQAHGTMQGSEYTWQDAFPLLLKVKLGSPRNKQFLKLMEEAPIRKAFEKYELEMLADYNKDARFKIKEQLYFIIDERQHIADLTEIGRKELSPSGDESAFMLPDIPTTFQQIDASNATTEEKEEQKKTVQELYDRSSTSIHCISQLLRAYSLYEKDVEYIVQDGKVMIVDENTGRVMPGRRWSDGLHSAVEAKESVTIEKESKTFATITLQNYFRMYDKLAGMTGTAETEATEFNDIYKLNVTVIPTNKPIVRCDEHDMMYKTRREKYNAAIAEVEEAHRRGQPVLVGTASVEASELLSRMLRRLNIPHNVLNAKYHEMEAEIVARAGLKGAVTIATNMAGRGTDIKLGEGVAELGGLYVVGTERHQSRRIDRQLRGRSGRQGDPGLSRFFVSLEDDLMRIFGNAGHIVKMLENSFEEGRPIQHPLLTQTLETAQKRFEESNYLIRKRLLQFDDVLNRQRQVIYDIRNDVLKAEDPSIITFELIEEEIGERMAKADLYQNGTLNKEAYEAFVVNLRTLFPLPFDVKGENISEEDLRKALLAEIKAAYDRARKDADQQIVREYERFQLLRSIDLNWQSHLTAMDDLRDSVSLRSYGQRDPLNEYKTEAFAFFEDLMSTIRSQICNGMLRTMSDLPMLKQVATSQRNVKLRGPVDGSDMSVGKPAAAEESNEPVLTIKRNQPKVGRNDPCPCGSGKKYKACCGRG